MALKIRLRRQGRMNRESYRLVLADARFPRDGKYIEMLGWYDPHKKDQQAAIEGNRVDYWLSQGAIPTENAKSLIARFAPDVFKSMQERKKEQRMKKASKRRKNKKDGD